MGKLSELQSQVTGKQIQVNTPPPATRQGRLNRSLAASAVQAMPGAVRPVTGLPTAAGTAAEQAAQPKSRAAGTLGELSYAAERYGAALLGAGENMTDLLGTGLYKAVEGVTSLGGLLPNPVSEWAGQAADSFTENSITRDWEESIERRYQPNDAQRNATAVGQAVMQMLPGIGASKVISAVGAGVNAFNAARTANTAVNAGRAVMGLQAAGGGLNEARQEGADTGKALTYGVASGLLETAIEGISGGIPGLGRGKAAEIVSRVISNPVVNKALDIAGEGGEEALSAVISPYIQRAIYDADAENATAEEIAQSAVMGMLAAGVLQAGLELPDAISDRLSGRIRLPGRSGGDTASIPSGEAAQTKTASTGEAGEYRAEQPRNVETPTVPIINLSMSDVAEMNGGSVPQTGNALRKEAISRARTRLGLDENSAAYIPASNVTRNGDEYVLKITKASLNKMLSPADGSQVPAESIVVLDNIERIANNGVYFKSEGDRKGRDQIAGYDHLMTTVYIDGAPTLVDMRVRIYDEKSGGENRLYYFTPEEIVTIKGADTIPPTGERRAHTISSEGVSAPTATVSQTGADVNLTPETITLQKENGATPAAERQAFHGEASPFSEERVQAVQQVQASPGKDGNLQKISEVDSGRGTDRGGLSVVRAETDGAQNDGLGAANAGFDQWSHFQGERSAFYPEGANAARPVDVPTTDPEGRRIRKTASTVMGAKAIPDEAVKGIQQMVLDGKLSYNRATDRASIDRAVRSIEKKGFQRAMGEFAHEVRRGVVSKDLAALGQQLLVNAANAGDGKATAELLSLYAQMETSAGQAVQAASILRKLDPTHQLYAAQRAVDGLQETLSKKYRDRELTIDPALMEKFEAQTDQEGRDAVLDEIYRSVAAQVPATWKDKWNAWRYLSMLANPRTHARNMMGNAVFQIPRMAKDKIAAAIEAGVSRATGGKIERTKAFASSPAMYRAAWDDFVNVRDALSGSMAGDVKGEIESRRQIFKTRPLEELRKLNSQALEAEDALFKRITYADALAGYLTANGVTADELRGFNGQGKNTGAESTAVNTDPAQHTMAEQVAIQEYQNAVDASVVEFIDRWKTLQNPSYKKRVHMPISKVSARMAADVQAVTGVNVNGFEHVLSGNALEHIEKRHGVSGKADQSMANTNDLARMGYVLENYDKMEVVTNTDGSPKTSREYANANNTPAALVRFQKRVNGTYYIVEAVPDTAAHQMRVVSAYMQKANGNTDQVLNMPKTGPQLTPEAPHGASTPVHGKLIQQSGEVTGTPPASPESTSAPTAPIISAPPTKGNTQSAQSSGGASRLTAELLSRARDYAGREAQRATFNDRNEISDAVSGLGRYRGENLVLKAGSALAEGVLPFRRTPTNILLRGLEYSPLGLAKGLTADLYQVKQGKKSAAEAIDGIAAGLTGSALFGLGALLLSQGLVTGGGGDDEKQDMLDDLTGGQNYALNLPGGGSVTLDWLAPAALPFFMGVEFAKGIGAGGFTAESAWEAAKNISEPMLEMSMLQSLNDIIDSVSFSENKLGALVASAVISYFTQAIPTIGGQLERTGEDRRMMTYVDKNSRVPGDIQYALGKASARIPVWDYHQTPYIDAWGREETTAGLPMRAFNNSLNPAYTSSTNKTPVDREIQRLYTATGEGGVVPTRADRYITVDGERKHLSMKQYRTYATKRGQTAFNLLDTLVNSSAYRTLNDDQKTGVVSKVYQYANAVAKNAVSVGKLETWVSDATHAREELGLSTAEYLVLYEKYGGTLTGGDGVRKAYQAGVAPEEYLSYRAGWDSYDTDGKAGLSTAERAEAIRSSGLSAAKQEKLWLVEEPDWAEEAGEAGVSTGLYIDYKVATYGIKGDKDRSGNSIGGSKKAKMLRAIDALDATGAEKDALYRAAGYADRTLYDAPWH